MVISVKDLIIGFDSPLSSPINFHLGPGESLAVMGHSGAGKSTLLNTILGMIRPIEGTVTIEGSNVHTLRYSELARLRGRLIGTVFQDGELLSTYTTLQNVALPRLLINKSDPNVATQASRALLNMGVDPEQQARNLSGGERQRVALARALINDPKLILADEPTGSLDIQTRDEVIALLFDNQLRRDAALILVTHDPQVAGKADRILTIEQPYSA